MRSFVHAHALRATLAVVSDRGRVGDLVDAGVGVGEVGFA
jgi:hypothetical protein